MRHTPTSNARMFEIDASKELNWRKKEGRNEETCDSLTQNFTSSVKNTSHDATGFEGAHSWYCDFNHKQQILSLLFLIQAMIWECVWEREREELRGFRIFSIHQSFHPGCDPGDFLERKPLIRISHLHTQPWGTYHSGFLEKFWFWRQGVLVSS